MKMGLNKHGPTAKTEARETECSGDKQRIFLDEGWGQNSPKLQECK